VTGPISFFSPQAQPRRRWRHILQAFSKGELPTSFDTWRPGTRVRQMGDCYHQDNQPFNLTQLWGIFKHDKAIWPMISFRAGCRYILLLVLHELRKTEGSVPLNVHILVSHTLVLANHLIGASCMKCSLKCNFKTSRYPIHRSNCHIRRVRQEINQTVSFRCQSLPRCQMLFGCQYLLSFAEYT
jgi:hypothetical protein